MTDRKLKILIIIIGAMVLLSAVGNMIYATYQEIDQPLFTAVNEEIVYSEYFDEPLTISYITNNKDHRRLEAIKFDGLTGLQPVSQIRHSGGFEFNSPVTMNAYSDLVGRYYSLKSGYIDLSLTEADIKKLEEVGSLTFGSGWATFDDGSSIQLDLGRITIHTMEHWDSHRLRDGAGGSDDYFEVNYKTDCPIQLTSLDLSPFEVHQEALTMELIVDADKVYTYKDLLGQAMPISVDRSFQVVFRAKDREVSSQWRFNMLSMAMTYEKEGQVYDTWVYFPFYGTGMDEAAVEAYVNLWRDKHE